MKTGLPRHLTVSDWPVSTAEMSTSIGGERQRRRVRVHLVDERPGDQGRADRADGAGRDVEEVAAGRLRVFERIRGRQDRSPVEPAPLHAGADARNPPGRGLFSRP